MIGGSLKRHLEAGTKLIITIPLKETTLNKEVSQD
jgi:hypothetical protein